MLFGLGQLWDLIFLVELLFCMVVHGLWGVESLHKLKFQLFDSTLSGRERQRCTANFTPRWSDVFSLIETMSERTVDGLYDNCTTRCLN